MIVETMDKLHLMAEVKRLADENARLREACEAVMQWYDCDRGDLSLKRCIRQLRAALAGEASG